MKKYNYLSIPKCVVAKEIYKVRLFPMHFNDHAVALKSRLFCSSQWWKHLKRQLLARSKLRAEKASLLWHNPLNFIKAL